MNVIATTKGYFGALIQAGQKFEVPDGMKSSWFKPVGRADEGVDAPSSKAGKSSTSTANNEAIAKATR